jgi:hypothetical protein
VNGKKYKPTTIKGIPKIDAFKARIPNTTIKIDQPM